MAFRQIDTKHIARFNSATSSEFLEFYESFVDSKILNKSFEPASKTFAPSSFRCMRRSWFRLRGVQPDVPNSADRKLDFSASIGTACHRIIQANLKEALKNDWVSVSDYLRDNPIGYACSLEEDGLETKVSIPDIPIRFACDGIIRWKGKLYLLEIKTSEFGSFQELTDTKPQHVDQIKVYASLLKLKNILVVYQDRMYGEFKVYEMTVSDSDIDSVFSTIEYVKQCVEFEIAPDGLPLNDPWCTPNMCDYYQKCKEYGRYR